MSVLSNDTAEAIQAIKGAVLLHVENTTGTGKAHSRFRFADNMRQWAEIALHETVEGVGDRYRVAFVYVQGFTSLRVEARQTRVTVTVAIEIIHSFYEGSAEDNSTLSFETFLGKLFDKFKDANALGFTDTASQDVNNSPLSAPIGENEGRPVTVDGLLAHRVICTLEIDFRVCR